MGESGAHKTWGHRVQITHETKSRESREDPTRKRASPSPSRRRHNSVRERFSLLSPTVSFCFRTANLIMPKFGVHHCTRLVPVNKCVCVCAPEHRAGERSTVPLDVSCVLRTLLLRLWLAHFSLAAFFACLRSCARL